jgi:hypothetical protein
LIWSPHAIAGQADLAGQALGTGVLDGLLENLPMHCWFSASMKRQRKMRLPCCLRVGAGNFDHPASGFQRKVTNWLFARISVTVYTFQITPVRHQQNGHAGTMDCRRAFGDFWIRLPKPHGIKECLHLGIHRE